MYLLTYIFSSVCQKDDDRSQNRWNTPEYRSSSDKRNELWRKWILVTAPVIKKYLPRLFYYRITSIMKWYYTCITCNWYKHVKMMTPFGLSHVYHYYLSVQYSWEDGVMYDISMNYFHAKWFVILFQDEPTRVMLYL